MSEPIGPPEPVHPDTQLLDAVLAALGWKRSANGMHYDKCEPVVMTHRMTDHGIENIGRPDSSAGWTENLPLAVYWQVECLRRERDEHGRHMAVWHERAQHLAACVEEEAKARRKVATALDDIRTNTMGMMSPQER